MTDHENITKNDRKMNITINYYLNKSISNHHKLNEDRIFALKNLYSILKQK